MDCPYMCASFHPTMCAGAQLHCLSREHMYIWTAQPFPHRFVHLTKQLVLAGFVMHTGAQLHCVSRENMDQWLASPNKSAAALPPMSRTSSSRHGSFSLSSSSRRPSIIAANSGSYAGTAAAVAATAAAADGLATLSAVSDHMGSGVGVASSTGVEEGMSNSSNNSSSSNLNGSGAPTFHLVAFPAKVRRC
jgi:hypothetical protein